MKANVSFLELVQLLLCSFNFGAICFVQFVHYPLFSQVGGDVFQRYHQLHVSKTTFILGTTLSAEMLLNFFMVTAYPFTINHALPMALLSIGWLVTFFMSVPQHRKLETGFSESVHKTLLLSNWIRVFCWGGALASLISHLVRSSFRPI